MENEKRRKKEEAGIRHLDNSASNITYVYIISYVSLFRLTQNDAFKMMFLKTATPQKYINFTINSFKKQQRKESF